MPERAGAAVHVHLVVRQAVLLHSRHGHYGERLVHLVEIDTLRVPAGALEKLRHRADRRGREPVGLLGVRRVAGDERKRREAAPLGGGAPHEDQRRGAIRDRARVGRGHGAILAECRLQRRDLVEVGLEGLLVDLDELLLLAGLDGERRDFPREPAFEICLLRSPKRVNCKIILRFAGKLIFLGALLGEAPHQPAFVVGVLEPVVEHVVDHLGVAHAIPGARLRQEVGRVGHRFHAAGHDDFICSASQEIVREHRRLHSRAAHLVHGRAARGEGQTGAERGLARRRLALPCGQHAAHDHFLHFLGRNPGALDRGADRCGAELGRGKALQLALEGAHRRSGARDDDDRIRMHGVLLSEAVGSLEPFRLPAGRSARRRAKRARAARPGLPTWRQSRACPP